MLQRRLRQARKAWHLLSRPVWRRALLAGIGASIEHVEALKGLKPRTVVDVGANIGQFTALSLELFPDARIVAFEPLSGPADRFEHFFERFGRVRLVRSAVGPRAERASMFVSRRVDSSSLLPISELQSTIFPGTELAGTASVEVAPLSQLLGPGPIARPALLKIDVQGAELAVLQGSADLLGRFDHVYVECSHLRLYEGQPVEGEIVAFLEAHGFELTSRHNPVHHPQHGLVQEDCLFTRATPTATAPPLAAA
jgi:FkbM family methyltransferase